MRPRGMRAGKPGASVTAGLLRLPAPLDELQVLLNWLVSKRNKYLGEEQLALAQSQIRKKWQERKNWQEQ